MTGTPCISVVIPTRDRVALLTRCLEALANQMFAADRYEVIVVDDGVQVDAKQPIAAARPDHAPSETQATVEAMQEAHPSLNLRYLHTTGACGPAAARNLGWRAARAPIIAFTDDDTIPDDEWLAEGLAAMLPTVSAVTGRVVVPLPKSPRDHELNTAGLERAEFVTANCFCRKSVLEVLEGFDERFTAAWREDSDLHFRLLAADADIVRCDSAIVTHPVRPANWGFSLRQQRNNFFEALLFKKHRDLYRRRIDCAPMSYYFTTVALLGAMAALPARSGRASLVLGAVWLLGTTWFFARRVLPTRKTPADIADMLVTSALIPPVALYWRLRGALKFRAWFW